MEPLPAEHQYLRTAAWHDRIGAGAKARKDNAREGGNGRKEGGAENGEGCEGRKNGGAEKNNKSGKNKKG